jgi:hypothetical protein
MGFPLKRFTAATQFGSSLVGRNDLVFGDGLFPSSSPPKDGARIGLAAADKQGAIVLVDLLVYQATPCPLGAMRNLRMAERMNRKK